MPVPRLDKGLAARALFLGYRYLYNRLALLDFCAERLGSIIPSGWSYFTFEKYYFRQNPRDSAARCTGVQR